MNFNTIRKYLASVRIIVEAIQLDFSAASLFLIQILTRHRSAASLLYYYINTTRTYYTSYA
jgi:hypothetical protein